MHIQSRHKEDSSETHENVHICLTDATIMIVDDEPTTTEIVKAFLEEVGYKKFILINNSSEVMNILENSRPDILMLDLMMPEVSGYDILSSLRKHRAFKHLPTIIMTSASDNESKLRALDLGATDFLAKPLDKSELILRVRNTLAAKAYQDQLAYYDPLTKLPNKKLFQERIEWAIKEADRYNQNFALLIIELDNFNRIVATIGPSAGDEVLRQISQRIEKVIRSADVLGLSAEDNVNKFSVSLFRAEGYGLSLIVDRLHVRENAASVANRIMGIAKEPVHIEKTDIFTTASIGIATYPDDSKESATLVRLATTARDYAKNRGGDTFQFSSIDINESYKRRMSLETRLRMALRNDELVLHYQPKLEIRTAAITGVEALLRWKSAEGLVYPGDFIPLAEEIGLIIPIGEWVLMEAFTKLKNWHQIDTPPLTMAVNLSAIQFNDPGFYSTLKKTLLSSGVNPEFVRLELTESLLLDDIENKIKTLRNLTHLGFKLSIDDFGTGYSSLKYLSRLPVDEIKIDRSFITDVVSNSNNRSIVLSIIFLSHCLGLLTVAEGVETQEQLDFLLKEHCDQYQGFFFSQPVPENQLFELLPPKK